MEKTLLSDLERGNADGLFTFIGNDGWKFSKDDLIDIFKEYIYVAEEKIEYLGGKVAVNELKREFIDDLKDNTDFYKED